MQRAGGIVLISVMFVLSLSDCSKNSNPVSASGGGITLSGSVVDMYGAPVSGKGVIVAGKAPVTSGADGSFTVSGVTTPYNIYVVDGTRPEAVIYVGLTTASPALRLSYQVTPYSRMGTVSGSVPTVSGDITILRFYHSGLLVGDAIADTASGAYSATLAWGDSATSASGTIYLFRRSTSTLKFDAYGTRSFIVSNSGTSSGNNFSAGDIAVVADTTISGTVVVPGTETFYESDLHMQVGNSILTLGTDLSSFSFHVPVIAGASYGVIAYGLNNTKAKGNILPGATNAVVSLSTRPQLSLPINNATNVDTSTTFAWNSGGGGVFCFTASAGGSYPTIVIYTEASTAAIPNLSSTGLSLPSNVKYSWYVSQYSTTVDNAASSGFYDFEVQRIMDFNFTVSSSQNFTTKP